MAALKHLVVPALLLLAFVGYSEAIVAKCSACQAVAVGGGARPRSLPAAGGRRRALPSRTAPPAGRGESSTGGISPAGAIAIGWHRPG